MTRTKRIELFDTTLRDGTQGEGISLSVGDKLSIAQRLDKFGVHYIEGGWPGSNEKETEFFEKAKELQLEQAKLVAFGMTCRKGEKPEKDKLLDKLLEAGTEIITIVGKSCRFHVDHILEVSPQENLRMIRETCAFLKSQGKEVFFDAEHFFCGYKKDPKYALLTLRAAVEGGVKTLILCDTRGKMLTYEIGKIVVKVRKEMKRVTLGIHAHNDKGLAVANTLEAVRRGVRHIQGTFNGFGERCGNADLCSLIPVLQLEMGYDCVSSEQLASLARLSRFIYEIANLAPNLYQPHVGHNAFAHKAGVHCSAFAKHRDSYQHIDPRLVGNYSRILISEMSGLTGLKQKAKEFSIDLSDEQAKVLLAEIKKSSEDKGLRFEGADGSLELHMMGLDKDYFLPFEVPCYEIDIEKNSRSSRNRATVWVRVDKKFNNQKKLTNFRAKGNGPVNALDKAMRGAIRNVSSLYYRIIKEVKLVDFKMRTINGGKGTGSSVRVLIEFSNGKDTWITAGVSTDMVEASCQALTEGLQLAISRKLIENQKEEEESRDQGLIVD